MRVLPYCLENNVKKKSLYGSVQTHPLEACYIFHLRSTVETEVTEGPLYLTNSLVNTEGFLPL